ncbi:unnamed protein product [Phytomonas sp. Hart1]|nr:unnamed protein product [Phytomonas sp. Hart1]|eukprot:CCW68056.1 unnamed protein product [Phytomonas sp. isolate Hart1]
MGDLSVAITSEGNERRPPLPGARTDASNKGFTLSFNEWQAFLAVLESGRNGKDRSIDKENYATLSSICLRLRQDEIHCPLVVLTVHAYAWWANGISDEVFMQRLSALLEHVFDSDQGFHVEECNQEWSDSKETLRASDEQLDCNQNKVSKRGLLKKGLKRLSNTLSYPIRYSKIARGETLDVAQKSPPLTATSSALLHIPEFRDLVCLFGGLLERRIGSDFSPDGQNLTTSDMYRPIHHFHEKEEAVLLQSLMDLKSDRPVARVALSLSLAIYAIMYPLPTYAKEGIQQLRLLESALQVHREKQRRTASNRPFADKAVEKFTDDFPSVGHLEDALLRRQYDLDARECLSSVGRDLENSLVLRRQAREAADSKVLSENSNNLSSSLPFNNMNLAERWEYCKSQYIGQRHVWDTLKVHFLSAGVFDVNKPTVKIFFGPSGYGKSELAKQIASAIHGIPVQNLESSGKLIYLHMPSFCTKDSIYSLVDPPAAHVGDGILLSALLQHPDAVVVLDEFEKSTTEAVQHIWLSAFQKNGVLRSLKRADRSVSTVRTTFILTCNIASETIEARRALYLGLSLSDQAIAREAFVEVCKGFCRGTLGDPFVNRVDYFFPFVPYTDAEREQFVLLLLERLLSAQAGKGRVLHPTPRAVRAITASLETFHGETVEAALRPPLLHMAQRGYREAVLTVAERIAPGPLSFILIPCHALANRKEEGEEEGEGWEAGLTWASLPTGPACLAAWHRAATGEGAVAQPVRVKTPPIASTQVPFQLRTIAETPTEGRNWPSVALPGPAVGSGTTTIVRSLEAGEVVYQMDFEKVQALQVELNNVKDVLLATEKELEFYKKKTVLLEKLLGVVLLALGCCLSVLYVIIGLKLTLFLVLSTGFIAFGLLGLPLRLIYDAARALFNTLGPFKSAVLLAFILLWGSRALKGLRCESKAYL